MSGGFDRRGLLRAGGLLSLAAVLDACSSGSSGTTAASTSAATTSSARRSAPAAPATTSAATPSATSLLRNDRACTLTHATIAGPTWFDAHDVRSDIRDGRPGVPLELAFRVVQLPSCAPVP